MDGFMCVHVQVSMRGVQMGIYGCMGRCALSVWG
jgi:hypothetical protein